MFTFISGLVIALFILSVLVLIHEFGHFIVAKIFGIKVEEFGYGFPPKAWGKKIGETLYTINWLPIGGFVKLYGEDDAGGGKVNLNDPTEKIEDIGRAFFARPVWQRALVVVAGVVMNSLLAFAIFYLFLFLSDFKTILPLYPPNSPVYPKLSYVDQVIRPKGVYIEGVASGSPAEAAGIKPPVRILSLDNKNLKSADELIKYVNQNKGKQIAFVWEEVQTGSKKSQTIIPRLSHPKNEGALGIRLNELPVSLILLHYNTPVQKTLSGISHPLNLMSYNFTILGQLIMQSTQQKNVDELSKAFSGPVAIVKLGGEINQIEDLKQRFLQFLNLAGLLSISLAVFNILPIPALDGGRLFFILIEGITRRKVSPKIEAAIHTVGMVILLGLVALVTLKDILQVF